MSTREGIIIVLTPTTTNPIKPKNRIINMNTGPPAVIIMTIVPIKSIIITNKNNSNIRSASTTMAIISTNKRKRKSINAATIMIMSTITTITNINPITNMKMSTKAIAKSFLTLTLIPTVRCVQAHILDWRAELTS